VNDKFTPLYSFETGENGQGGSLRRTAKDHSYHEGAVRGTPKTMGLGGDTLQQAIQYFILNRCSFSGSTLSGGFAGSEQRAVHVVHRPNSGSGLRRHREIHNDFFGVRGVGVGRRANNLFLDPPYFLEKSQSYTGTTDMHESFNHESLYACFERKKLGANLQQLLYPEYVQRLYGD
jgi:DNA adenine methylase